MMSKIVYKQFKNYCRMTPLSIFPKRLSFLSKRCIFVEITIKNTKDARAHLDGQEKFNLQEGDVVRVESDGIGYLENPVR